MALMSLLRFIRSNIKSLDHKTSSNYYLSLVIHKFKGITMSESIKRKLEDKFEATKFVKVTSNDNETTNRVVNLKQAKGRPIPERILKIMTEDEMDMIENVKTSCTDIEKMKAAIKLRQKYRLCVRLPEDMDDSSYYIEDGLRRVYPYHYLYQSYAKRRWLGRKLRDVIKEEFRDITEELLRWRFESGRILVNGEKANYDHVIKDNDTIANRVHRHELPVLAAPIQVIHRDKDLVVVNKPPSLPIHPCGRFRHNSILSIVKKELGLDDLKVVHRLDRLVSGVLILATNAGRARVLEESIRKRHVQKEYVCRVEGEFPLGPEEDDGEIVVNQPLEVIAGKIGITVLDKGGKESLTTFKRLNYNGKTSAVICRPKTGRMHQIRVHLQYLGHPIVNDGLYNCDSFGPKRGKGGDYGKSYKRISEEVISKHRADAWLIMDHDLEGSEAANFDEKVVDFTSDIEKEETLAAIQSFFTDKSWKDMAEKLKFDPSKFTTDSNCNDCRQRFYDPPKRSLFLYLHALQYSGNGWSFKTDLPVWAKPDWPY